MTQFDRLIGMGQAIMRDRKLTSTDKVEKVSTLLERFRQEGEQHATGNDVHKHTDIKHGGVDSEGRV